jgi:hypothetical protein
MRHDLSQQVDKIFLWYVKIYDFYVLPGMTLPSLSHLTLYIMPLISAVSIFSDSEGSKA